MRIYLFKLLIQLQVYVHCPIILYEIVHTLTLNLVVIGTSHNHDA